ncbi:hypothetical protein QFZ99_002040 [Paraburkholderia atlantica]
MPVKQLRMKHGFSDASFYTRPAKATRRSSPPTGNASGVPHTVGGLEARGVRTGSATNRGRESVAGAGHSIFHKQMAYFPSAISRLPASLVLAGGGLE